MCSVTSSLPWLLINVITDRLVALEMWFDEFILDLLISSRWSGGLCSKTEGGLFSSRSQTYFTTSVVRKRCRRLHNTRTCLACVGYWMQCRSSYTPARRLTTTARRLVYSNSCNTQKIKNLAAMLENMFRSAQTLATTAAESIRSSPYVSRLL